MVRGAASLRRIPTVIWLITALWVALLLGASVLWPISYGYDEVAHFDMAYAYAAHPFRFYGPGQLHLSGTGEAISRMYRGDPPSPRFGAGSVTARGARPTLSQLGVAGPSSGNFENQMVQHPPLYYWSAAVVLRIPGVSSQAWDLQLWFVRLLSVIYLLPIPIVSWASTRRLRHALLGERRMTGRVDAAVVAALVPLTIPNLIRDGSAITNDSLLIATSAVLTYLLLRVIDGDLSRRTGAWIGVVLAAALLTKGLALVLPPIVLAAYLIAMRRHGRRAALPPLLLAGIGAAVGAIWWVRNLIRFGTVQIDGYSAGYKQVLYGKADNSGTLSSFAPHFLHVFLSRIWGGIGLPDDPSPGVVVTVGWLLLVAVGLLAAAALLPRRTRATQAVLLALPILTTLVIAYGSFATFKRWSTTLTAAQGRYVYGSVVAVGALASIGWERLTGGRWPRWTPALVALAAIMTNAVSWTMILRDWYAPPHQSFLTALHSGWSGLLRWSALPPFATGLFVLALPSALAIAVLIGLARAAGQVQESSASAIDDRPDLAGERA